MKKQELSDAEIANHMKTIRSLSNRAKFSAAYKMSKQLTEQHPSVLQFAYYEAVMTAEDEEGFKPAEVRARYRKASKKLRRLLSRLRRAPVQLKASIRNEYYWFSKQPKKQYLLGKELVKKGVRRSHYSQGVGAVQLAKVYGLKGRRALCLRWARISEQAWLQFFAEDRNWFNSYFFYAMALGYQGRIKEMDRALARAASIARKPKGWRTIKKLRCEILEVVKAINSSKRQLKRVDQEIRRAGIIPTTTYERGPGRK